MIKSRPGWQAWQSLARDLCIFALAAVVISTVVFVALPYLARPEITDTRLILARRDGWESGFAAARDTFAPWLQRENLRNPSFEEVCALARQVPGADIAQLMSEATARGYRFGLSTVFINSAQYVQALVFKTPQGRATVFAAVPSWGWPVWLVLDSVAPGAVLDTPTGQVEVRGVLEWWCT